MTRTSGQLIYIVRSSAQTLYTYITPLRPRRNEIACRIDSFKRQLEHTENTMGSTKNRLLATHMPLLLSNRFLRIVRRESGLLHPHRWR